MAGLAAAARNSMLDDLGGLAQFASLHTADPGVSGTNEVAGGSPAYARNALTWAAAVGSTKASSAEIVFDVPGGTTITHLGYWSAAIGGTYYGSRPLDAEQTFSTQGTYTIAPGGVSETLT